MTCLKFLQINLNTSIFPLFQTSNLATKNNFDIICCQELPTSMDRPVSWPYFHDYKWVHSRSVNTHIYSGILVNTNHLKYLSLSQFNNEFTTTIFIQHENSKLVIVSSYFHASNDIKKDLDFLSKIICIFQNTPILFRFKRA